MIISLGPYYFMIFSFKELFQQNHQFRFFKSISLLITNWLVFQYHLYKFEISQDNKETVYHNVLILYFLGIIYSLCCICRLIGNFQK